MGTINFVCGASQLNIHYGQDVVLFPLKRVANKKSTSETLFYDRDEFFRPFCLPIFGKYNDEGSIEHIKKDENTDFLESKFNTTIENIVALLSCSRDIYAPYGEANLRFGYVTDSALNANINTAENLEKFLTVLEAKLDNNVITFNSGHKLKFNWLSDSLYELELTTDNKTKKSNAISSYAGVATFLENACNLLGYYIHFKEEHQGLIDFVAKSTIMMVDRRIYNEMLMYNKNREFESIEKDAVEVVNEFVTASNKFLADYSKILEEDLVEKEKEKKAFMFNIKESPYRYNNKNDYKLLRFSEMFYKLVNLYYGYMHIGGIKEAFIDFHYFDDALGKLNKLYMPQYLDSAIGTDTLHEIVFKKAIECIEEYNNSFDD